MTIINTDILTALPTLPQHFRLVFADPPFNIGVNYDTYSDKRSDYAEWVQEWVAGAWACTSGVLVLHGPDHLAEIYLQAARHLGFATNRVEWCNWWYEFGNCTRKHFVDARCHIFIYAREGYTWNPDDVLIESARVKYGDKRVHETERGGLRLPGTVWGVGADGRREPYWGRVQGNNAERQPFHKNQLPEVYMKRLVLAYTNPGDRVLDCFGGSGTLGTVATALTRQPTTIELSQAYCQSIEHRIKGGMVR